MPDLTGVMSFPGIDSILSGSLTLSHGISPSVATIEIQPQADFVAELGPLTLFFGVPGVTTVAELVFSDCRIDQASFRYGPDGLIWALSIWDRRWRWQWGGISGTYNERIPLGQKGSIDAYTLRSPQLLCAYCLDLMGEVLYDVSQVPNDPRPEVRWVWDNPARALADLCDQLGCRVVLGTDDVVRVCRAGVGAFLPDDGVMQDGLVFKPPQRPDAVIVVGGPTRYETAFALHPAGRDTNGNVVHINDLSYKPKGGWGQAAGAGPPNFLDLPVPPVLLPGAPVPPGQQALFKAQNPVPALLAMESVYRWYRISMVAIDKKGATPQIPGWRGSPGSRIDGLWQILPCEDRRVAGYTDSDGLWHSLPALVVGTWTGFPPAYSLKQVPAGTVADPSFYTIDQDRGIVRFNDFFYIQRTADNPYPNKQFPSPFSWAAAKYQPPDWPVASTIPAQLFVILAVSVRDPTTSSWERYLRVLESSGAKWATPPRILKHEEIVLNVIPTYDGNYKVTGLTSNAADCDPAADYALVAADLEYQYQTPQDRTYMGLRADIPLDGAIQQITWVVGPGGATTRASRNTEWNPAVPPYTERRQLQRLLKYAVNEPEMLSLVRDRAGRQPPRGVGAGPGGQG